MSHLINFTEQDNLQGSRSGSIGVRGKQDGLGRGAGSVTPGRFKLWLLNWLNEWSATEIERLRLHNQVLMNQVRYLNRSNAQYKGKAEKLGQYEGGRK